MKTVSIELYEFSELTKEAQAKVLSDLSNINVDYDWWTGIYEDANSIGLFINAFDTYYNTISAELEYSNIEVCQKIIETHGERCETYQIAKKFLEEFQKVEDDDFTEFEYDNSKELKQAYLKLLRDECNYLQTDEAIIETIESNEYSFTKNGNRFIEKNS